MRENKENDHSPSLLLGAPNIPPPPSPSFLSRWWRLRGRPLRSPLSAERTWLSSHPLWTRIICLCLSTRSRIVFQAHGTYPLKAMKLDQIAAGRSFYMHAGVRACLARMLEVHVQKQTSKRTHVSYMRDQFGCTYAYERRHFFSQISINPPTSSLPPLLRSD